MVPTPPGRTRPRLAVVLVVALCPHPRVSAAADTAYSVALHVHGSMSEFNGSMEWHAERGVQTGVVDAIWWTDHDWRVASLGHLRGYDFENATVDSTMSRVTEPDDSFPGALRFWERRGSSSTFAVSIVDSVVSQGAKALRFSSSDPNPGTTFFPMAFTQWASRLHNTYSLASRVHCRFSLFPESLDPVDGKFVFQVTLSEHADSTVHQLRYVAGSMEGEGASSIALPWTGGQWSAYDLDVTGEAIARFTTGGPDTLRGEDNSLYDVEIRLETRGTHEAVVFFDDYHIDTDSLMTGAAMMDKARDMAALYEGMYAPVTHFVGTEISWFPTQPHLNGYAPGITLVDYTGRTGADSIDYAVDQIHAQGGAVSLNHVFGTGHYPPLGLTEAEKDAMMLAEKKSLIATRAYGADLLEVGYRLRNELDLGRYLETWDAATANAVFLTGNGVTDSHGSAALDGWGPWIPGNPGFENNFVTWLFAPQIDEAMFIAAMKAGRAFFGDPFVFDPDGSLDLWTAEGFPMGRVVLTDRPSHDVLVEIDGLPATAQVRLRQGEIRIASPTPYTTINYLRDEILAGSRSGTVFRDTVSIDTTLPGFVRLEVDDQGTATVYSNPLHFLRSVPPSGIAAPRVAAALGDVLLTGAADFTMTNASWTAGPPTTELAVTGDEEVAGLGTLVFDVTALGEPDQVIGGGFTSYDYQAGILTLTGFSGAGSVVRLQWGGGGATGADAAPPRVDRLALAPGRPNPFGRGTVTELALPRAAPVRLEVLDVQGRRLRVLVDEPRDAGVHRVVWDGRDALGREVPAGVYFLRLRALGRTLTAKAVRIR